MYKRERGTKSSSFLSTSFHRSRRASQTSPECPWIIGREPKSPESQPLWLTSANTLRFHGRRAGMETTPVSTCTHIHTNTCTPYPQINLSALTEHLLQATPLTNSERRHKGAQRAQDTACKGWTGSRWNGDFGKWGWENKQAHCDNNTSYQLLDVCQGDRMPRDVCSLKKCIHSFNKCSLSPYYVPGTILGKEDKW